MPTLLTLFFITVASIMHWKRWSYTTTQNCKQKAAGSSKEDTEKSAINPPLA